MRGLPRGPRRGDGVSARREARAAPLRQLPRVRRRGLRHERPCPGTGARRPKPRGHVRGLPWNPRHPPGQRPDLPHLRPESAVDVRALPRQSGDHPPRPHSDRQRRGPLRGQHPRPRRLEERARHGPHLQDLPWNARHPALLGSGVARRPRPDRLHVRLMPRGGPKALRGGHPWDASSKRRCPRPRLHRLPLGPSHSAGRRRRLAPGRAQGMRELPRPIAEDLPGHVPRAGHEPRLRARSRPARTATRRTTSFRRRTRARPSRPRTALATCQKCHPGTSRSSRVRPASRIPHDRRAESAAALHGPLHEGPAGRRLRVLRVPHGPLVPALGQARREGRRSRNGLGDAR